MPGHTYDLEERSYRMAKSCRKFVAALPKTSQTFEDGRQLIRSSGSVAANYIEANEALSRKDFKYRIKICKKEAKESILWLRLLGATQEEIEEMTQIMKIMGAILEKTKETL